MPQVSCFWRDDENEKKKKNVEQNTVQRHQAGSSTKRHSVVLTVPEGPDGRGLALAEEPAPPEEALVMESEDLRPSLCQCVCLWGVEEKLMWGWSQHACLARMVVRSLLLFKFWFWRSQGTAAALNFLPYHSYKTNILVPWNNFYNHSYPDKKDPADPHRQSSHSKDIKALIARAGKVCQGYHFLNNFPKEALLLL